MNKTTDYKQLQDTIDKVIGQIGLEETEVLLNSFINNIPVQGESEQKMITQYVISLSIEVFHLNEREFLSNNTRNYQDARYCCFHLLHKYTGKTFSKIARLFNLSDRQVSYGYRTADERLSIPKFHIEFVENYKNVESKIARFLAKMA